MPKVQVNEITINYDQQGTGEPLIPIPYLAADYACYAFQVAEYAKHFTCISVDLRGAGESGRRDQRPVRRGSVVYRVVYWTGVTVLVAWSIFSAYSALNGL